MFPTTNLNEIIDSINSEIDSSEGFGRVFFIDFKNGRLSTVIENGRPKECTSLQEKVRSFINVMLRTEVDKYKVYEGSGFGLYYKKYLGNRSAHLGFIRSEMRREIEEQLSRLKVFESLENFSLEKNGSQLFIEFEVVLKDDETYKISEVI